jgi:hypothetical protein
MMAKRWESAVCIASGPSLTEADVNLVRLSGVKTVTVNSSWKLAPWCDVIYAGDRVWWDAYGPEIDVKAKRYTCSKTAARLHRAKYRARPIGAHYNSGMCAIDVAQHFGAKTILLLGYDCSVTHGLHHHGKHKLTKNPNETRCKEWQKQFRELAQILTSRVINCSRYTEIDCFERMDLEQALCELT